MNYLNELQKDLCKSLGVDFETNKNIKEVGIKINADEFPTVEVISYIDRGELSYICRAV